MRDCIEIMTWGLIAIGILGLIGIFYLVGIDDGYKQGQIDCINGKIEYCLIDREDNTKVWNKCEGKE